MALRFALCLTAACFVPSLRADQGQDGRLAVEQWEAAFLEGGRAGHVRTEVRETLVGEEKVYRTTVSLHLNVKRFNQVIQLRMDTGAEETEDGKVLGVFMRQYLGSQPKLTITGTVKGKQLLLVQDGKAALKPAPWNEKALGPWKQRTLFKDRKVKPGDDFKYLTFEPSINLLVEVRVKASDYEEIETAPKIRRKLLRISTRAEKIEGVQLPDLIQWLDDDLMPVRSQFEVPGLGKVVLVKTTREAALAPGPVATLTDVGVNQSIKLPRRIVAPYKTRAAVYRIAIAGDEDPATAFARDDRQGLAKLPGGMIELRARAVYSKGSTEGGAAPEAEFTESSYFINSADPKVRALARSAVGAEKNPWQKALRIEKWVHQNMKVVAHEAVATADHVARTLEGDCTEFAMLAAAMCRAEGVASRTAVGLVYADTPGGPVFAFHMWTEAWDGKSWAPLDATLGQGGIGATHLKIADHSWAEVRHLAPLLPVVRVLGKLRIEVVSVE